MARRGVIGGGISAIGGPVPDALTTAGTGLVLFPNTPAVPAMVVFDNIDDGVNLFTSTGSESATGIATPVMGPKDVGTYSTAGFAAYNTTALPGMAIISGAAGGTDQRILMTYDGATDSSAVTTLAGARGSAGGINLIPLAGIDRFQFIFDEGIAPLAPAAASLNIRIISGATDVTANNVAAFAAGTPTYDVLFSLFPGIDFAAVDAIVFEFADMAGAVLVLDQIIISSP